MIFYCCISIIAISALILQNSGGKFMDTEAENNYDKLYINIPSSKSHSKYLFAYISSFFVVAVLNILKAVVLTTGSNEV